MPQSPIFCDIGANVGSYSLWLASLKESRGTVYAFEPTPASANELRKNILANQLKNIELIEKACSDNTGTVDFFIGQDHHSSSLNSEWAKGGQPHVDKITVETITLDDFFLSDHRALPDFIKMDIEGGAVFALPGCRKLVRQKQPIFFIESHTPDEDRAIGDFMLEHQYEGYRISNHRWVADKTKTHPDPDGVWGSILLCPVALRTQINTILQGR
jgi:FkbM family methyltransferase